MGSKRKAVRKWEGAEQVASAGWRRLQKSKMERKREVGSHLWRSTKREFNMSDAR